MWRKTWMLSAIYIFALGCYSEDLHLKIRFDQINGLRGGERVLFEGNDIGQATDVFYGKDGIYLVDVKINNDFKNALTEHSRFFIVKDPSDQGRKAIEVITVKKDGRPLEDAAVVKGATRLSALIEKLEDDMSKTMIDLKQRFKGFSEELKQVPEREDIKNLQKDLDQLLEEMKRSGAEFRDKVQKELAPRLQEEIDRLKERLRELGREKEAEPLQTKMDEMRKI
jgi:paraquat-inducible protein B